MEPSGRAQFRHRQAVMLMATWLALAGLPACSGGSGKFLDLGPGPNNAMLNGPYAFSFFGQNSNFSLITAAGSFTADGNGNIAKGLEDETVAGSSGQSLTFTGTYAIGSDGRGTAQIKTSNGAATWQFTMLNSSHALLIRFDLATVTASGAIDKQDPTAFSAAKLEANYVFGFSGIGTSGTALSTAGLWTMDGAGNIKNGLMDVSDETAGVLENSVLTGTYTVAASGRGTATINSGYATQNFVFYIVDATDLKFVEMDGVPAVSGEVLEAAPPYSLASLKGGLAFTLGGTDHSGVPLAAGAVITADGNGNLSSGTLDLNDGGIVSLGASIAGTYNFAANGRGILNLTNTALGNLQFALYPAQNRTIELVEIDVTAVMSGAAKAQTGSQFSVSSLAGPFAVNFTGVLSSGGGTTEEDITGQVRADGTGNLTGTLDINTLATRTRGASLSASTYTLPADGQGRGTATLNIPGATFNMQTYQVDANNALFLDVDSFRILTGIIEMQQ
jgi:hypothetical protein